MDAERPVDSEGRVRLPDEVREELDLEAGDRVTITLEDGEVTIEPGGESETYDRTRKSGRSPVQIGSPSNRGPDDEDED